MVTKLVLPSDLSVHVTRVLCPWKVTKPKRYKKRFSVFRPVEKKTVQLKERWLQPFALQTVKHPVPSLIKTPVFTFNKFYISPRFYLVRLIIPFSIAEKISYY